MPAKSKAQRRAMAIAEHHPSKLYKRNKGLKKMSKAQLRDFAETKEKGLPKKKSNPNSDFLEYVNSRKSKTRKAKK